VERQRQAHTAPGPAGELEALAVPDALERALAAARAPGADAGARKTLLDRLATLDLGEPRATADRLEALLSSGALATVRGADGSSARAVAVERLLALGYPYALEVAPEDLTHWREERPSGATDGRGLAVLVMTVAVCLSLWGLSEPPTGAGLAVVLSLEAATLATALRPSLRRLARQVVFTLGIVACILGFRHGVGTLLPGVAAFVAARLFGRGVRGVD
jgi:hypothetical protein